jgi:hypothetical protein
MLFKQLQKDTAEQVTLVVKNVSATTMTTGLGVALVGTGASLDGISATIGTASDFERLFIGIARRDIPVNAYGTVCCWGVADSVAISANVATSITITAGDQLWPSAVAGQLYSSAARDAINLSTLAVSALATNKAFAVAVDTVGLSSGTIKYIKAFIKAL